MYGEPERVGKFKLTAKEFLACAQRQLAEICIIQIEQIKEIEIDLDITRPGLVRIIDGKASLQSGKTGCLAREGYDFTVKNEMFRLLAGESIRQFRIGVIEVLPVAGEYQ